MRLQPMEKIGAALFLQTELVGLVSWHLCRGDAIAADGEDWRCVVFANRIGGSRVLAPVSGRCDCSRWRRLALRCFCKQNWWVSCLGTCVGAMRLQPMEKIGAALFLQAELVGLVSWHLCRGDAIAADGEDWRCVVFTGRIGGSRVSAPVSGRCDCSQWRRL